MTQLAVLRQRLDAAEAEHARLRRSASTPRTFADEMFLRSFQGHLDEIRQAHDLALRRRGVEVVELRFTGPPANGTLPLGMGNEMLAAFRDAVAQTAAYFATGQRSPRKGRIRETFGLSLSAIAPGSTRCFITAQHPADLFGARLVEETLDATFDTLDAETVEQVTDAVGRIGSFAASHVNVFLKKAHAIGYTGISAEWDEPSDGVRVWSADRARLSRLRRQLDQLSVEDVSVTIRGMVVGLASAGTVRLESAAGEIVCRFSQRLLPVVQPFRLGDRVVAKVTRTTATNAASGRVRVIHNIETLRDADAFEAHGLDPEA